MKGGAAARWLAMATLLALGSWAVRPATPPPPGAPVVFRDVAAPAGCRNVHTLPRLSPRFANIMPWMASVGASVAAADFDGDSRTDLYVVNSGPGSCNRLFRNRGDGGFQEVAGAAGAADCNRRGANMDALFFDFDNDGDQDLYLVKWGAPNRLFENAGAAGFVDVTARSGTGFSGYGNAAIAFDYDRDGRLDLLVANFFPDQVRDPATGALVANDLWRPVTTRVLYDNFTRAVNGGRNLLFHNLGDGRFEEVARASGLVHTGWSLDAGAGDLDGDGWPDLYVANDFGPDELYFNAGGGEGRRRFQPLVDREGHPGIGNDWWKGMNVEMGDVDGNGRLDIYVTNVMVPRYKTDEGNMLWLNEPAPGRRRGLRFRNRGPESGTQEGGWGWGAKLADFDLDGRLDLFTVNGFVTGEDPERTYWFHLQEMVTQLDYNTADTRDWAPVGTLDLAGHEPSRLFFQEAPEDAPGAGPPVPRFREAAREGGVTDLRNGRGVALADFDGDGDVDFYVANQGSASSLYRNEGPADAAGRHWLALDLAGNPEAPLERGRLRLASSRDAIGARVELCAGGRCQIRELAPANGFAAQSEKRLHFGLGQAGTVDRLTVLWPSGRRTVFGPGEIAADRLHRIEERP